MANSNNTQLSASEKESAKRAANDAAYGALYGAVIGANPTGSNQHPNANGSMTQADINALRGMTAQDYLNAFGTAGKPVSTIGNSSGGANTTPNTFQDPPTNNTGDGGGGGGGGGYYYTAPKAQYEAPTLPSATSQEDYIKAMYDASQKAQEEALLASYEKNTGALDYQQGKIAPTYDAAANNAGAQAAIQRANFNESANASGLNTGAGSQAELSMRNAEAANISAIRKAQADAQADLDYQRSQLTLEYQNAIREAIAKNELQKAQALYEEAKRVDESLVSTAINQANLNWQIWKYNNS